MPDKRSPTTATGSALDDAALVERIHSFERWHYQIELRGHLTPIWDETRINRHAQRRAYFMDPLVQHLGGSLGGRRVLGLISLENLIDLLGEYAG